MLAEQKLNAAFIIRSAKSGKTCAMPRITHIFAAAIIALCLTALAAAAQDHNRARDAVQAGQARPLGQILGQVISHCPGRFLDAGLRQGGGGLVYVIKILRPGGRVAKLVVDAKSSAIRRGRCFSNSDAPLRETRNFAFSDGRP